MKSYHDIVGDGGSDVLGQVGALKAKIAENLAGIRRIIAIGSGKGGVGKSTLTAQLAAVLRSQGRAVAILDADVNGPSQARLGGLRAKPPIPSARGLEMPRTASGIGVVSMGSFFSESEAVDFDNVAPGESQTWRGTKEFSVLAELLATVAFGELDVLLVDLPPGADRTFQYAEFLGPEVPFVLVTIPSELSRGVVRRSVAALRKTPNAILGYVENMSGYLCPDCGTVKPLFPSAGSVDLGVPKLAAVPFDPALAAASDAGSALPQGEDRPTVAALRALAEALVPRDAAGEGAEGGRE